MSDVTKILERARNGDPQAANDLIPLVYQELRNLAAAKMAREAGDHTLQPTALVHEAWLRLGGDQQPVWQNRAHFFGAAAEAMRRILVDRARRKGRLKRGSGVEPESIDDCEIELTAPAEEVLQVDSALENLAAEDPEAAEVVKLRYFVGLPVPKVAEILGMSPRSVDRIWAFARVRLKQLIANS